MGILLAKPPSGFPRFLCVLISIYFLVGIHPTQVRASGHVRVILRLHPTSSDSSHSSESRPVSPGAPRSSSYSSRQSRSFGGEGTTSTDDLLLDLERLNEQRSLEEVREEVERTARAVTELLDSEKLTSFGTRVQGYEVLWLVRGLSVTCSEDLVETLAALPQVAEVMQDPFLEVVVPEDDPEAFDPDPWHVEALWRHQSAVLNAAGEREIEALASEVGPVLSSGVRPDGSGVTVGILDSGISPTAPFADRVVAYRDFTTEPSAEWRDDVGHGTSVAGCIVHPKVGIAPGAELVVARVIEQIAFRGDDEEDRRVIGAFASRIVAAMQWMLDPLGDESGTPPRVVTNSWGFPESPYLDRGHFGPAIEAWRNAGIVPVFAAGNQRGLASTVMLPADHPSVIAVGAHDRDLSIPEFSLSGVSSEALPPEYDARPFTKPDFVAPGVDILTYGRSRTGEWGLRLRRGTSFAAPLVAGAIAILEEVSPGMTYDDIYQLLQSGSHFPRQVQPHPRSGWGSISIAGSLSVLLDGDAWYHRSVAERIEDAHDMVAYWDALNRRDDIQAGSEAFRRFRLTLADSVRQALADGHGLLVEELLQQAGSRRSLRSLIRQVKGFVPSRAEEISD